MKFDKYTCGSGKAVPVNPYIIEQKGNFTIVNNAKRNEYIAFETFAQSNTVSCPEDLMGEYEKEAIEVVWRFRQKGCTTWVTVLPEAYKRSNNDFNDYKKYCIEMDAECQEYLQLKPVVKEENNIGNSTEILQKCRVAYQGYLDELLRNNDNFIPEESTFSTGFLAGYFERSNKD